MRRRYRRSREQDSGKTSQKVQHAAQSRRRTGYRGPARASIRHESRRKASQESVQNDDQERPVNAHCERDTLQVFSHRVCRAIHSSFGIQ
ncbi:hypothetical protein ATCV1_z776L [Acanthocystis turfacea chlorella virus 1]|uniref:Uncharacterized protein z776L n=1 Tax=Chlorovirus heliozoae TaxID=322019 RepID=A7KA36_9PHYC|nr:hypothetical protein ATCV1_z776L [Acanthocystis turfacea chlorella virus 1]ABT16910.1 hypothetical protein ATCV1_z776L [Acanthocystis turfacea chlorella virus 1]